MHPGLVVKTNDNPTHHTAPLVFLPIPSSHLGCSVFEVLATSPASNRFAVPKSFFPALPAIAGVLRLAGDFLVK